MGSTKIRKLCKNEAKWTDKNCDKHKHNFTVHAVARLKRPNGNCEYYDVMKCEFCNSFKGIPRPGSSSGYVGNMPDGQLPIIRLKISHRNLMALKGAELDE